MREEMESTEGAATTPVATANDEGRCQRNEGSEEGMLTRGSATDGEDETTARGSAGGRDANSRSTRSINVHDEAETDGRGGFGAESSTGGAAVPEDDGSDGGAGGTAAADEGTGTRLSGRDRNAGSGLGVELQ